MNVFWEGCGFFFSNINNIVNSFWLLSFTYFSLILELSFRMNTILQQEVEEENISVIQKIQGIKRLVYFGAMTFEFMHRGSHCDTGT